MPGRYQKREFTPELCTISHFVDDSHEGVRADVFLKECLKRKSRAYIQKSIAEGTIVMAPRLTGQTPSLKPSTPLLPGDELRILIPRDTSRTEPVVDFEYRVLFEDDDLMVVDKPGNLPVHPAGRFFYNTLLTHLRNHRPDHTGSGGDFFMVHRIDRETSGLLIVAKRTEMARNLVEQFFLHKVEKRYLAVVQGHPSWTERSITHSMKNDPHSEVRLKMTTCPDGEGMAARTDCRLMERGPRFALVEARPKTGRQHQIRVHLAKEGLPLVGDKLYGGYENLFLDFLYQGLFTEEMQRKLHSRRHGLHATYLGFRHPRTGVPLEFISPLPEDLKTILLSAEP